MVVGVRWRSDDQRRIATLLLGLYRDDGELDYVGTAAVAPTRHDEIAGVVEAAAPRCPRATFLRAQPVGRWG